MKETPWKDIKVKLKNMNARSVTLKEKKNYSYSFLLNLLSICIDETCMSVYHTVLG